MIYHQEEENRVGAVVEHKFACKIWILVFLKITTVIILQHSLVKNETVQIIQDEMQKM